MGVLAVDIGGTKVKLGLVSQPGKILQSTQFMVKTGVKPQDLVLKISVAAKEVKIDKFSAVGIACAGFIDAAGKKIIFSPNLKWQSIPLATIAERVFRKPVRIENDVNAAALGEYRFGAGKGKDNIVVVFVGTGIGGGIVSDGHLIRGGRGFSAEIGHTIFRAGGELCDCGRRGCFEAYAGGKYIVQNFHRLGGSSMLTKPSEIYRAAGKDDPVAKKVWKDAVEALTLLCTNLATTLDTEVIILGGGVVENCRGIEKKIAHRIRIYFRNNWVNCPEITVSKLGADAALLGAAFSAMAFLNR